MLTPGGPFNQMTWSKNNSGYSAAAVSFVHEKMETNFVLELIVKPVLSTNTAIGVKTSGWQIYSQISRHLRSFL